MKVFSISIRTRGDMEPFLAIGEILIDIGHQVICAFPEQFRSLVTGTGMGFISLGSEYIALLESDIGKTAMGGGSGVEKMIANIQFIPFLQACFQDRVTGGLTCMCWDTSIERRQPYGNLTRI